MKSLTNLHLQSVSLLRVGGNRLVASLCLLTILVVGNSSAASDATAAFDTANKLYEQGKFTDAAGAYEVILQSGTASPALYFNLGNAHFKAGQIGQAIAAYRHAEQFTPRDPDVRANLQFARNQVQGPTLRPNRWQRALATLSLNEWTALAALGVWLTFLSLGTIQLRPALKPALRSVTTAIGAATCVLAVCLGLALANDPAANLAVVTAREVTARNGPLDESQSAFTANDGAELRVLDQKNDWLQVTDDNRRVGWLKRSETALLDRK